MKLNDIPHLETRLNAFKFKFVFPVKRGEISADVDNFRKGCKEIKECTKLHKLMELILAVGNFMNGGTNRGDAAGFKLNTLTKLGDTKTTDNKTTLNNYLVKLVQAQFPDLAQFSKELSHIEAASKVSMSMITGDVATLKKDFIGVQKGAESVPKHNSEDKFQAVMSEFVALTTDELDTLVSEMSKMEADFKELTSFFGEDPKIDPAEFFTIFVKFLQGFESAVKENEAEKLAVEKAAKREAAKKIKEEEDEKKKKLAEKKGPGVSGGGKNEAKNEAVVDELLSTITSGSMFQNRRRPGAGAKAAIPV